MQLECQKYRELYFSQVTDKQSQAVNRSIIPQHILPSSPYLNSFWRASTTCKNASKAACPAAKSRSFVQRLETPLRRVAAPPIKMNPRLSLSGIESVAMLKHLRIAAWRFGGKILRDMIQF